MLKAEIWEAALLGTSGGKVDPYTAEQEKKKLMLERFQVRSATQLHPKTLIYSPRSDPQSISPSRPQEEHPGFDFSDAEFNGDVPSAKDFMGGVKY